MSINLTADVCVCFLCQHRISTLKLGSTISASRTYLPAWEMQHHCRGLGFPAVVLKKFGLFWLRFQSSGFGTEY